MAGWRAFIYVPPGVQAPNELWQTGHMDPDAPPGQACLAPDPQTFTTLQSLIEYAAAHGETLRQFNSVAEVNAICAGSGPLAGPQNLPPTNQVPISGCVAGVCGPSATTSQPPPTGIPSQITGAPTGGQVAATGGANIIAPPSTLTSGTGGGSPSPFSGNLPGMGGPAAGLPGGPAPGGVQTNIAVPSTTPSTSVAGFSLPSFLTGPMGFLALGLLVLILLLGQVVGKKGG